MTRKMIGPMLLLAAMASPHAQPVSAPPERVSAFRPTSGVTARATATVRIVSGVKFGSENLQEVPGADRRDARLIDRDGQVISAKLLEFQ